MITAVLRQRGDEGIAHRIGQFRVRGVNNHLQVDLRMGGMETLQPRHQPARRETAAYGQPEPVTRAADGAGKRTVDFGKGRLELAGERLAGRGQFDPPPPLLHQPLADDFRQQTQLMADRALGHAQLLRSRSDGKIPRNRFERM